MSGNIKNYNFNKLDIRLSNSDYWDMKLGNDENGGVRPILTGDCFVSLFDFNNESTFIDQTTIGSLISWNKAINTGYTFSTFGLTGIDNGAIPYIKNSGDAANTGLTNILTGTTLNINSNNKKLILKAVSGSTGNFIYPITTFIDISGTYSVFCGGFYQGFYKIDGSTYQVLPTRVNKAWVAEFWVKRTDPVCTGYTGTTLNDLYPNNKGFFFYMGTRSENKFWNNFYGLNTGCTSACTVPIDCSGTVTNYCTIPKEDDFFITTQNGLIGLSPNQINTDIITNKFLIYGRAMSGSTCSACGGSINGLGTKLVCNYDGSPIKVETPKTIVTNTQNPFLVYGRASKNGSCSICGNPSDPNGKETVCSFTGFTKSIQHDNLDHKIDVIDNSLGFRIKDDGSIGYRYLSVTGYCSGNTYVSGVTINEQYSASGIVSTNAWTSVIIRYTTNFYDDCELEYKDQRVGRLMFYIDGKLKFTVRDFPEFIAKRLNEYSEKQIGVPFNISLGGGSQGLIETQTFDGRDEMDLNLDIQNNFAGSFIGGISTFKFNICDLYFDDIQRIYNKEKLRYHPFNNGGVGF